MSSEFDIQLYLSSRKPKYHDNKERFLRIANTDLWRSWLQGCLGTIIDRTPTGYTPAYQIEWLKPQTSAPEILKELADLKSGSLRYQDTVKLSNGGDIVDVLRTAGACGVPCVFLEGWDGQEDLAIGIHQELVTNTDCPSMWSTEKEILPDKSINNLNSYMKWLVSFIRNPIVVAVKVNTELELNALQKVYEGTTADKHAEDKMKKVFWLIDYSPMYQVYLGVVQKIATRWKLK